MSELLRRSHTLYDEATYITSHRIAISIFGLALSACGYSLDLADCEATCESGVCPDGFTCRDGLCRIIGAGNACQGPGETTLRQTANDQVDRNLVFGCTNPDQTTAEGSWYRVFSLAEAGITKPFEVSRISLGICFAVGMPNVSVKIGSYSGGATDMMIDLAKVTGVTSLTVPVKATQVSQVIDVPITATVPPTANMVVEIAIPDLNGSGNQVNMGFSAGGEAHPAYLRSPRCGTPTPSTTVSAGLARAHLVLTVTGQQQ